MKKKKPKYVSLWILIAGLTISLAVHQYHDNQMRQELALRQQKILQMYQQLEQILDEHSEVDKEQTEYLQQMNNSLQKLLKEYLPADE